MREREGEGRGERGERGREGEGRGKREGGRGEGRERKGEERGAYVMLSSVMAFTRMVIGGATLFSDCSA